MSENVIDFREKQAEAKAKKAKESAKKARPRSKDDKLNEALRKFGSFTSNVNNKPKEKKPEDEKKGEEKV